MSAERERLERYLAEELANFERLARHDPDEDAALKTVCHTVLWACGLHDHLTPAPGFGRWLSSHPDAVQVLEGLRMARNHGVHRCIRLVRASGGFTFPATLPASFREYRWVSAEEIPIPTVKSHRENDAKVRPSYVSQLAGRPVRRTFETLTAVLLGAPR